MRRREEIEESFKEVIIPSNWGHVRLQMEILLDIRALLNEILMDKRMSSVKEERLKQQKKRLFEASKKEEEMS